MKKKKKKKKKKKTLFTSKLNLNLRMKPVNSTFGAWFFMVLKSGHFETFIRNTWKFLRFGTKKKDGNDHYDRLCEK
jgi:hypothetical protein